MKAAARKLLLNQLINVSWTIVAFTPILIYWYSVYMLTPLYIFLAVSLIFGFLPKRIFIYLQLNRDPEFYTRIGVKKIRRFVQDGDIMNRFIRKDLPQHRIISSRHSLLKYRKTIEMYERFHFVCLLFFLLTAVHALLHFKYYLGIIITAGNFLYNVCPILLQQYNKAKLSKMMGNTIAFL